MRATAPAAILCLLTACAPSSVPKEAQASAVVRPGIEVLLSSVPHALRGKRIALLTNHSAVDRAGTPDIDGTTATTETRTDADTARTDPDNCGPAGTDSTR